MELIIRTIPTNAGIISQSSTNLFPLITQDNDFIITQDGDKILVFDEYFEYTLHQTEHDDRYEFDGWYINNVKVSTANDYTIYLDHDVLIEARYNQVKFDIGITANIIGTTPYQSAKQVDLGDSVEIRAREVKEYKFIGWSDGVKDNPRTLTPTTDIYLTAQYQKK